MPHGTDPLAVQRAARECAQVELADHKYVMVLHDHQANPPVHISVRAETRHGKRLNPRKADLQRLRETFAEKLRGWGVEAAAATRRAGRAYGRNGEPLWHIKARECGRLRSTRPPVWSRVQCDAPDVTAEAWQLIAEVLGVSAEPADRAMAVRIPALVKLPEVKQMPQSPEISPRR